MVAEGPAQQYADLMKRNHNGTYLYVPRRASKLYPGAVGYFDQDLHWHEIADIFSDGEFKSLNPRLELDSETTTWTSRTGETEDGNNIRANVEGSGLAASAPVDASLELKNSRSSTCKASLIASSPVVKTSFKGAYRPKLRKWVDNNGKALSRSEHREDIRQFRLWVIHTTWVTEGCAVQMNSGKNRDMDLGATVGMTGVAKVGGGGGWFEKLENEGFTTYKPLPGEKGWVISVGGLQYRHRRWTAGLRSNPFEDIPASLVIKYPGTLVLRDENGNITGFQKIDDMEGWERQQRAKSDVAPDADGFDEDEEADDLELRPEDIEAEKAYMKQESEQRQREDVVRKVVEYKLGETLRLEDEEARTAELKAIVEKFPVAEELLRTMAWK